MAVALIAGTACSAKKGSESTDDTAADSLQNEATAAGAPKAYPWDFPEGIALDNPEAGQYVLSPYTFYPEALAEEDDPGSKTLIFYSTTLAKYGDTHSTLDNLGEDPVEMPNSLIILLPKGEKAHVGDVLLTWWQSGSGLQRAIVTDASDPERPRVVYLDLNYGDDELANKYANEQLKPSSFDVLRDGEWQPGAAVAAFDGKEWKSGILIHATDNKVLMIGFSGVVYAYNRSDCRLIPIKQDLKVGDEVMALFVSKFTPGYKITRIDRRVGRVWIKKDDQKENIVSILEVVKSL